MQHSLSQPESFIVRCVVTAVLSTLYLPEVDLRGYPVDAVVTEYDGLGELEVSSPGRGVEVVMVLVMAALVTPQLALELEPSPAPVLHLLDPDAAHARVPAVIPGHHTIHRQAAAVRHLQTILVSTSYNSS